jgi:uncharacterized repeat protein (TIGR01451 family)
MFYLFVLFSTTWILCAKGTLVGTPIANAAEIAFTVGGVDRNLTSSTDEFVVDRIVHVDISWEDSAPVEVAAGDVNRVLTFRVTNLGNGDENITLGYEHNVSSDFLPTGVFIFLDDGDGIYTPGVDTNVSTLTALGVDANVTLFLVGDIPDDNTTAPSKQSLEAIRATSNANATSGADRQHAVDIVVRKKEDVDRGVWVIRDYWLATNKSAIVHSDDNATHTGTRITYAIECYIDGNATGRTIPGVTVRDTIPAGTRYVAGSLRLDATTLTDVADGDAGKYDTNTTRVEVRMGTLSGAMHKKVRFDVEVK